jgi:3-dehydroquinate synthase
VDKIRVKISRTPYDVLIGAGLLRRAGREVLRLLPEKSSQVFVVTSPDVRRHWGEVLEGSLERARLKYKVLEMNDGEPAKKLEIVERAAEQMVEAGADRKSLVVAFGGGVVGDAAGFLAAIFMRGLPVIQIPTTVVSQLDASIGGKTGVNLKAGKNLIGAFHQPRVVLVDPDVLATLAEREFRSGLFEALKCGVIRDARLFEFMKKRAGLILERQSAAVRRIIVDSVRVKASVVSADERESGVRRILNFGHTVGHALEAATGYTHLLHGEAVGWGMIAAAHIAREVRCCTPAVCDEICSLVAAYAPLPALAVNTGDVVARMASDKKTVGGAVHFVLPQKIGKVKIAAGVPPAIVHAAVDALRNYA